MGKYRCSICGYKFENYDIVRSCPVCNGDKFFVEVADEFTKREKEEIIKSEVNNKRAVVIDKKNPAIERVEGCINCGMCMKTCMSRENMPSNEKGLVCVGCGQCIITCPKRVLEPKNDIYKFLEAKKVGKICIATIAPASRVTIGSACGYEEGAFLERELVGLLKYLGFDYVYDVGFGADLTVVEESCELMKRLTDNGVLPMISSCCSSWVRYAEIFYPNLLDHLSTCKSPIEMLSSTIREYLPRIKNIKADDIYIVSITPCTAKKWEIVRSGESATNAIITVCELVNYIESKGIDLRKIKKKDFDGFFGKSSGAGLIFGNTGGVTEAILRQIQQFVGNDSSNRIEFSEVRGYNSLKEARIKIDSREIRVAVIDEMSNALPILDMIEKGDCRYDFIEIMNCRGGCIGGGGNLRYKMLYEDRVKLQRMKSLYAKDEGMEIRTSFQNPFIKEIYNKLYDEPLSDKAYKFLHTSYRDRSFENIGKRN